MARLGLLDYRNALEFQHTYQWNVLIQRPPNLVPAGAGLREALTPGPQNQWDLHVQTHALPTLEVESAQVDHRGWRLWEPGRVNPQGQLDITMLETTDAWARRFIRDWMHTLLYRQNAAAGANGVDQYTADLTLTSLDNDGEGENYTYVIKKAFILTPTPPNFDGSTNEPATWTFTLQYNDFEEKDREGGRSLIGATFGGAGGAGLGG